MMISTFDLINTLRWILFASASSLKQQHPFAKQQIQIILSLFCPRWVLESTTYRIGDNHAYHYNTDVVSCKELLYKCNSDQKLYPHPFYMATFLQRSKSSNLTHIDLQKSLTNLIRKGYDLAIANSLKQIVWLKIWIICR